MNLAATARRAALAAASALVLAGTVAPVADAAAPTPAAPAPETCRDVAVVAARGTDQTDPDFGDEGETLRGLLDLAEARHPGLSSRAELIALDREVYPATLGLPQLAEEGEQLSPADTARRALEVIPELGQVHATDPRATIEALPGHLERREAETGCRPDYVLLGYSQGATVLTGLEARLHAQSRLRGVIYLGDPHAPRGALRGLPELMGTPRVPAGEVERVEYCLPKDFSCDFSAEAAALALGDGGGPHDTYFTGRPEHAPREAEVADALARMVDGNV